MANQQLADKISNTAKMLMKIYLDVCCINRPFDDQTEERIRMKSDIRSINEIKKLGIDALAEALGPVDMARFLQSFDLGSGDYTKERTGWLDQSLEEILEDIKRKRKE
jgi:hypothetical protein